MLHDVATVLESKEASPDERADFKVKIVCHQSLAVRPIL